MVSDKPLSALMGHICDKLISSDEIRMASVFTKCLYSIDGQINFTKSLTQPSLSSCYPTLAVADVWVGWSVASVTVWCMCGSVCPCSKRKMAAKFGMHILYGMHWPGDQKIKVQGHRVTKTIMVTWLLVAAVTIVLLALDCMSYDCSGF